MFASSGRKPWILNQTHAAGGSRRRQPGGSKKELFADAAAWPCILRMPHPIRVVERFPLRRKLRKATEEFLAVPVRFERSDQDDRMLFLQFTDADCSFAPKIGGHAIRFLSGTREAKRVHHETSFGYPAFALDALYSERTFRICIACFSACSANRRSRSSRLIVPRSRCWPVRENVSGGRSLSN